MVSPTTEARDTQSELTSLYIKSFYIAGGIFGAGHNIRFPVPPTSGAEPGILVLSGRNGSGKTSILRMISEVIGDMNFDTFRKIPFSHARLELSDGHVLVVEKVQNENFPLRVDFGEFSAELYKSRTSEYYSQEQQNNILRMRHFAQPILSEIQIELLDIHRSMALKKTDDIERARQIYTLVSPEPGNAAPTLSNRVRNFMREAQINYRKFFAADELELLPRIVQRFQASAQSLPSREELLNRARTVESRFTIMKRFGLRTDDADIKTLVDLLQSNAHVSDPHSITLVEAYVEMQENRQNARELVAKRLLEFEAIMDEFLQDKSVRIDSKSGLRIVANGITLPETDLSSGEYHFLYMMVAALLCQRSGTIIAIDEPELSLHVTWQRKVIGALARCASGASPVFLFATHAPAIAAEYADREYQLAPIE